MNFNLNGNWNFRLNTNTTIFFSFLLIITFLLTACGVKGPPSQPKDTALPIYQAKYTKKPDLIQTNDSFILSLKNALAYKIKMISSQKDLEIIKEECESSKSRRVSALAKLKEAQAKKFVQKELRKFEELYLEAKEREEVSFERYSKLCLNLNKSAAENKKYLKEINKNYKEYMKILDEYRSGDKVSIAKNVKTSPIKETDLNKHAEQSTFEYQRVLFQLEESSYLESLKEIENCEKETPAR
ncbi:MAG: hypothetical protein HQK51_02355 [Oligoflexia bacterium]|nr:hypothetical protein [Oligoflexia bacterium]